MKGGIANKVLGLFILTQLLSSRAWALPPEAPANEVPIENERPPAPSANDSPPLEDTGRNVPEPTEPENPPGTESTPSTDDQSNAEAPHDPPAQPSAPAESEAQQEPPLPPAGPRPAAQDLDEALAGHDSTGTPEKPSRDGEPRETGEDEPLPEGERRRRPDYDGRPDPNTDAGDIMRWGPRVVFFPLYLVMQYGIRVPIVWTATRIEENHITDRIADFFSWDDGKAALYPLVSFDFGIRPNAGLVFKWQEALPRHDFAATGFVGPDDLWAFGGRVDQKLFRDESALVRWKGSYVRRPDNVFYGLSDVDSRCNDVNRGCRYRSAIAEASLGLFGWEKSLNQIIFNTTFRHARFDNEGSDSPPLTDEEAAALPGFQDGYQIVEPRLTFALDTRDEDLDFHTGTGLRLEGLSAFAVDVSTPDSRWFRAGGEAGAFYDIGFGQVLATSLYYEGIVNAGWSDPSGNRIAIPFFELPYLGGPDQMKGFLRRRLMGENAIALNFEYRYPITWALDASVFTSIGNTFRDLASWNIASNYLSYGLSFKIAADRSSAFEAILGWGSNRLDEPSFDPFNQFRFALGVNKGF